MTLTPVRAGGVLAMISKAARADPDATMALLGFAWQEAIDDFIAVHDGEITKALDEDTALLRRTIMRVYVAKRAAGDDVAELLELAEQIGVTVDVAKVDGEGTPYEQATGRKQPRASGRWVRFLTGHNETTTVTVDGTTTTTATHHPGLVDAFKRPTGEDGKVSPAAYLLGEGGRPDDRPVYRQLRAAGGALAATSAAASNGPGLAVGATARAIGEIGPEAERVLGDGIRRTAYRYRGTERQPDKRFADEVLTAATVGQHLSPDGNLPDALHDTGFQLHEEWKVAGARRPGAAPAVVSSAAGALGYHGAEHPDLTSDQLRMRAAGDVAVNTLRARVPNLHLASISLRAGKLPPSVGVIIDEDGDLVTEAQGYNGDHYLPFDLRNLGRLHGGQYVRTRTTGGPTDEDIYTALLTGTRQTQVVSNSGVFTLEFDPTVRGGRRYNDKARQMVGRYAALLEQLGSGKLLAAELPPEEREKIRARALSRAGGDAAKAATLINEETDKAIATIAFTDQNEAEIEARARQVALAHWQGGQTGNKPRASEASAQQVYDDALREERQKARDAAARVYRLNGEGYNAALNALQQEFPFFIRHVEWEPMQDFLGTRKYGLAESKPLDRVADIGYTTRGALEPARVAGRKQNQVTPTAPAAAAATGAATATSAATPPPPAVRLTDTPFGAEFALAVPPFATFLAAAGTQIGSPEAGASTLTEADALSHPALNWWGWALAHHGGAQGVGKWLLAPDTPEVHLDKFDALIKTAQQPALEDPYLAKGLPELQQLLDKVRTVRAPYAAPDTDDPVLATPDLETPKPQPITEAILAANGRKEDAAGWLGNTPRVEEAIATLQPKTDAERAALIEPLARTLNDQLRFGEQAAATPDPEDAEAQRTALTGDISVADAIQAHKDFKAGMPPKAYLDLAALQKAWTFLRALEVRKMLGQAGGAVPFVPGLPEQVSKPVAKRGRPPRLVLHQPGSPAARGLAARGRRAGR